MAEIYLARQAGIAGFEKRVVIKRMLPHFAADPGLVEMFLGEARLAATLDHPNIAQVYDIGESTGDYYYAMEYVPGVDLRAIVQEERRRSRMVAISIATAIGRGMCAGLDYAHSRVGADGRLLGIVHRDVSLSNILVSYEGAVKVTDFGVAKVGARNNQTQAGMLKGKVGYMSPEQVCGATLDRRSDIFGIGIVMWELLTGQRLFVGGADFAVLQRIVDGVVPPLSAVRSDVPAALEAIVMRALHWDREARFPTARDMQRALEVFARDHRLAASNLEVGEYMTRLFPPQRGETGAEELPEELPDGMSPEDAEPVAMEVDGAAALPMVDWEPQHPPSSHRMPRHARHTMPADEPRVRGKATMRLFAAVLGVAAVVGGTWAVLDSRNAPVPVPAVATTPAGASVAPGASAPGSSAPGAIQLGQPGPQIAAADPRAAQKAGGAPDVWTAAAPAPSAPTLTARPSEVTPAHDTAAAPGVPNAISDAPPAPAIGTTGADPDRSAELTEPATAEPEPPAAAAGRNKRTQQAPPKRVAVAPPRRVVTPAPAPAPRTEIATNLPHETLSPARQVQPSPLPSAPTPTPTPAPAPPVARITTPMPVKPAAITPPPIPRGSLDAVPAIRGVNVTGSLQGSIVRRSVERVLGSYRDCYKSAARSASRTPADQVRVTFEIDESGMVRNVQVAKSALPGLAECVQRTTARIRSAITPDVGVARASIVVGFEPAGP